jgi:DNA-3-methyladenine glycosylase I
MVKAKHQVMVSCPWAKGDNYVQYHNTEWGLPCRDDNRLFEKICLEGQQAGLSWITVLNKRDHYRKCFYKFNPNKIAKMSDDEIEILLLDTGLIRNRLKLYGIRKNALAFLEFKKQLKKQDQTFSDFIWSFVGGEVVVNRFKQLSDVPVQTDEAVAMSKALKKAGFTFVGPTICYAFMQSMGLVNDHLTNCPCHPDNEGQGLKKS